ncbi:MAG: hypothetical protein ACRD3S_21560 [Terracidiphilus sp.]
MDSVAVSPDKQQDQPTASTLAGKARFVLLLLPYAVVDLVFFVRFSALIASHTASDYLVSGVAFEACFLTSLVPLWMCLVPQTTENQEIRYRKNLPNQVCFLVIMLFLALMEFASITQAYDKFRAR